MKTKKIVPILIIAIIAVMMIATVITNDQYVDAASKKVKKVKVTYNANGGKIGSKKTISTNINKGSKLKKFPTTPKRTGYAFKGWYTKKTGGKKVNMNTKLSKSVVLYAQWMKITSASKLVGHWQYEDYSGLRRFTLIDYYFYADGTFQCFDKRQDTSLEKIEGKYSVSNGKVYLKQVKWCKSANEIGDMDKFGVNFQKWSFQPLNSRPDMTIEYTLSSDNKGNYLLITEASRSGNYYSIGTASKFYKQ